MYALASLLLDLQPLPNNRTDQDRTADSSPFPLSLAFQPSFSFFLLLLFSLPPFPFSLLPDSSTRQLNFLEEHVASRNLGPIAAQLAREYGRYRIAFVPITLIHVHSKLCGLRRGRVESSVWTLEDIDPSSIVCCVWSPLGSSFRFNGKDPREPTVTSSTCTPVLYCILRQTSSLKPPAYFTLHTRLIRIGNFFFNL